MASVNFYYSDKKANQSRIMAQLTDGKDVRIKFSTGIKAKKSEWNFPDPKKKKTKGRFKKSGGEDKSRDERNKLLDEYEKRIESIYLDAKSKVYKIDGAYIKSKLSEVDPSISPDYSENVLTSLDNYIKSETTNSDNFMRTARPVLMYLSRFSKLKGKEYLKFSDLDLIFLESYENYLSKEKDEFTWNSKIIKKKPLASGTVSRHFTHLRLLIKKLPREVEITKAIQEYHVTETNKVARSLNWNEIKAIMNIEGLIDQELLARDIFLLTSFTGLRITVATNLRARDISGGFIHWINTKNKAQTVVSTTIHKYSHPILAQYKSLNPTGKLFPPIAQQTLNVKIKNICRKAGIEKPEEVHNHTGRHSYNSLLYALGIDTFIRNEEVGHAHSSVNERVYTKVDAQKRKTIIVNTFENVEQILASRAQKFTNQYDEI
ncbi:hypothetical protein GCM10011506_34160 [Marivirga lumbricoides]|uniref:Tyr recombinase domain-containing protein n=1 Tax=Marivirga lumbricoides TaxID=1046115 RepID=A0ABQ1MRW7_9BACT|nr:hypothetical protein GCM10011506_34160 [Marivirga lumbricoides]